MTGPDWSIEWFPFSLFLYMQCLLTTCLQLQQRFYLATQYEWFPGGMNLAMPWVCTLRQMLCCILNTVQKENAFCVWNRGSTTVALTAAGRGCFVNCALSSFTLLPKTYEMNSRKLSWPPQIIPFNFRLEHCALFYTHISNAHTYNYAKCKDRVWKEYRIIPRIRAWLAIGRLISIDLSH